MALWRKTLKRALIVLVSIVALFVVAQAFFGAWQWIVVPPNAPRIAISLSDSWLNDLGITRSTYDQAMARAGAKLVTVEPDDAGTPVDPGRVRELLSGVAGLLLTGGGDVDPALYEGEAEGALGVDRQRDDFEIALVREAERSGLPVLGICRGCQLLNVARGGALRSLRGVEELADRHFGFEGHAVRLETESALARLLESNRLDVVASFHGQAVDRLGRGLRVAARAEDGVIEAVETIDESWILCVQWHPELSLEDGPQQEILRAFVEEARRARRSR